MSQNDPTTKEAVILVPGIDGLEPGDILSKLERGLINADKKFQISTGESVATGERKGRSVLVEDVSGARELHLFEAHWGDQVDSLSKMGIVNQIVRGLKLMCSWFKVRALFQSRNRYLIMSGTMASLGLMLWWYGVTVSALTVATFAGTEQTASDWLKDQATNQNLDEWLREVAGAAAYITQWWVGIIAMASVALLKPTLDRGVNIIHFAKRYIDEENLRNRLWRRISELLNELNSSGEYSRITIVSHSFGTAIHIDWIADHKTRLPVPLRHITMGGPLAVMALMSPTIHKTMQQALNNPATREDEWFDFFSRQDWLCTATPDASEAFCFKQKEFRDAGRILDHIELHLQGAWTMRMDGQNHTKYFESPEVIDRILS